MDINLWNPGSGLPVGMALLTAFLLGMVHGATPDEHTWPITFSYAIGGYSSRRGLLAGLTFSLAFTVQRALASELAYFALYRWFAMEAVNHVIFLVVGLVMWLAGRYLARGQLLHLGAHGRGADLQDPRPWMPAVHGFIAGWGVGAFAMILYTVLAPAMPSAAWAWLPGALFGLGTTVVQALAGGLFGWFMARRRFPPEVVRSIALVTAARTLGWGGVAFFVFGLLGLLFPAIEDWRVDTGLHVHNLAHLDLDFVLLMLVVIGIGVTTLVSQWRYWSRQEPPH